VERPFTERRRSPRVPAANGTMAIRPFSMPVRLLDLSSEGLLLACERPLTISAISRVISFLAGRRLDVELVVRHVSIRWDEEARGYLVGGRFPALDQPARLIIESLLASTEPVGAGGPASWAAGGRSRPPSGERAYVEPPGRRRERSRPKRVPVFARPRAADSAHAGDSGPLNSTNSHPQPA